MVARPSRSEALGRGGTALQHHHDIGRFFVTTGLPPDDHLVGDGNQLDIAAYEILVDHAFDFFDFDPATVVVRAVRFNAHEVTQDFPVLVFLTKPEGDGGLSRDATDQFELGRGELDDLDDARVGDGDPRYRLGSSQEFRAARIEVERDFRLDDLADQPVGFRDHAGRGVAGRPPDGIGDPRTRGGLLATDKAGRRQQANGHAGYEEQS